MITKPGVYDIPPGVYHQDPVKEKSLSASGARMLLPPSCPALYKYSRLNPPKPKPAFAFGHAAHKLVLGIGREIVPIDAEDWRTKVARQAKVDALRDGKTPLLRHEFDIAQAMAAALRSDPIASALLGEGRGTPEQTLVWRCTQTGIWCRAMVDCLPKALTRDGNYVITDYKTADSAAPEKVSRAMDAYGYHIQGWWYIDGAKTLGLAEKPRFALIVQDKTPPYLVTVAEPNYLALDVGAHESMKARRIYAECVQTGRWRGYTDDIELLELPPWTQNRYLQEIGK